MRANGITKRPSPRPSPEGEGDESPAVARHPLLEGEEGNGSYRTEGTNQNHYGNENNNEIHDALLPGGFVGHELRAATETATEE